MSDTVDHGTRARGGSPEARERDDLARLSRQQLVAMVLRLEADLEAAVYGAPARWRVVANAMGVGEQKARILLALHASSIGLTHAEIDDAIGQSQRPNHRRLDPEFRTVGTIKSMVYQLRRLHPWLLEPAVHDPTRGLRLTPEGRGHLDGVLDCPRAGGLP